ncbi:MAG TPA: acyl carrier protein [Labilithrix sp.]
MLDALVRRVLSEHLRRDAAAVQLDAALQGDLGLSPLDVVVVAIRLADAAHVDLPYGRLDRLRTVADLVALTRGRSP